MTVDTDLQQKLARLKNYATRYELAMMRGGDRLLVCYSSRRGRQGIFEAVRSRVSAMTWRTGTDQIHFAQRAEDGATMGEWTIRFTGRTQREAYIGGALEYCQHGMPLPEPAALGN
jgi:hypothetical protein